MNNGDVDAFPAPCAQPFGDGRMATGGLTKRELFAAMAMQGLLTDRDATPSGSAAYAVKCADALLRALAEADGADSKSAGSL